MSKQAPLDQSLAQYATKPWQQKAVKAVITHGSIRAGAAAIGRNESSVRCLIKSLQRLATLDQHELLTADAKFSEAVDLTESDTSADLVVKSQRKLSEEQVVELSGLSTAVWRVKSHRKWTTTMKLRVAVKAEPGEKQQYVDQPIQVWNYHYTFERLISPAIQRGLEHIFANWKPTKLSPPRRQQKGKHLIEVDLFDVHFGKLCWDEFNGEQNYDIGEAAEDYSQAIATVLERISSYAAERFLLPIGNDFFQTDNWAGTTTKGTPVAADNRITKVFQTGFEAVVRAIQRMREVAPVELLWVPGNHDLNTSWSLMHSLSQRFRGDRHVHIDMSNAMRRRYYEFGQSVIGFQHGEKMKPEKMVIIAPTEFPDWGRKRFREIHCGHLHTRKDFTFLSSSEYGGTMVRYLSALSATDEWHYDNGYVGNKRAAEVVAWHPEEGPVGTARAFVT